MQPSTMTEWLPIVVGLLTVSCFHYEVSGASESCILQCGEQLQTCSCHASCEGLGSCCRDYHEYCIRIIPHSGTLMGGKDFIVLNVTFGANSTVVCRFSNETNTKGYIDQDGHAHCISPLLFETGRIPFAVSVDRDNNFTRLGTWLAVHHSKASVDEKSTLTESKKWQYYGTPGYDGTLTLTWNLNSLPHKDIRIEVWGYGEKGTPYNDTWSAHWTYLYTLALSYPNNGNFTFTPTPAQQSYNQWEVGMLRIVPSDEPLGERNVHAIWSPVHALAWHLEESFRNNSAAWAYKKCLTWREAEKTVLPNFLKETPDCPCTLAQSRADTGRYHTDYGCDIEKGSVCTYHPGAVHCVRSIQPSAEYAAGQQCCYDSTGAQVLTFDSVGGSTPDRGHDWGSPPYRKPPRIPGFSHWLYDVITFYYCCLWSDSCQYYLELRPSSDCRTYKPPKAASAFGDPHFVTFDGANYTFNGKGEYTLVSSSHWSLTIQGRTKPFNVSKSVTGSTNNSDINVTSFSSVAMQENRSDVIEVRLKDGTNQELQTLLNQEEISFEEQSWMDLKGVFVYSSGISNVTVMFPSGAGVEVRGREGFLAITVLLPEEFINQTQGLLGVMNNNPVDDFTFRNGTVLPADATAEELFQFGADWAVINESSRFTYDSENLINDYKLKHDPSFLPIFSFEKIPSDLIRALCGDDKFCTFDGLASEDQIIAKATKISYLSHSELVKNLQAEVSCGWLAPPENGTKTGTTYLAGSVMLFNCNLGFILNGTQRRTCLPNGTWSGDPVHCLVGDNGSCASQCGKKLQQCSCHVTCENLKTCCPDYRNFCIRISPNSGLIMGGRDFIVLNVTFVGGSDVKCRFKGEIITQGYIDKDGSAHCISPLLYETGRVPFEISADGGGSYPYSGTWLSVHPGKVKETEKCTLVNETKWQYYGTPNVDGTLTVQWDSTTFANHAVNIEVWGYEETGSIVPATGLCSVAMREGESDVVEVRLAASSEKVEILLNNEVVNFDRSWIDLKGVFIFSGTNQNVSIMFPSGAGVEVRGKGPFLSVTVLLPETFMNQTQGLLGVMNHNPKDDFMFRNGTLLPSNASPLMLFQLGADWAISNSSTLFTYDSEFLIKNYKTKHDPDFRPHFSVLEDPLDPLKEPVNQMCGLDNFCRFDALTTRELAAGNATKFSHEVHKSFVESLQPVVSCGWIGPPANGKKVGSSYLTGSEVTFSCNKGYILIGPSSRACQMDGTWSGHLSQCVADNTIGIVLGSLFGFLTLLVLILLIVLHERKRIKKKEMNVPSVTYQPSNDL
ncbi:hypothetical protein GDO86_002111 [Hymenochirus boettgeri]|uniref:Sushi domain-containing protein 2 n=1 Tax=Hymenochirus boettgeri TaxID=247094 RepID=A0A8T2KH73_9PIPI|nr:hypothetical protein GDO86_002111 [Hymenochirus boettgeri]